MIAVYADVWYTLKKVGLGDEVMRENAEKMYELAFQYKSTKLWQQLYDDELFAVQLGDGEIGYCSIMGELGDHIALGLYVGESGYQSYRFLLDQPRQVDDILMGALLTSQDCLQCSFENKDMLSDEELEEVRAYAAAHDKPLRGKNAFPQFTKYRPGRYPWHFDSPVDEQRICAALSAAIALKKMLRGHQKYELGLASVHEGASKIPLLVQQESRWVIKFTALPDARMRYPVTEWRDEMTTARIKRLKRRGKLQCGVMRLPSPVQDEEKQDEAPYFPLVLVCLNLASGVLLKPILSKTGDGQNMAAGFAEMILSAKVAPERVELRDEQTKAILSDFCGKAGIQAVVKDNLGELDDAMLQMMYRMDSDTNVEDAVEQVEDLCETLMQMRDGELKQLPEEMVLMLLDLDEDGLIPEALGKRLRRIFR